MDSTSSTGDIFPPPLASSRSGGLKTALLGSVVADLIPPPLSFGGRRGPLMKALDSED